MSARFILREQHHERIVPRPDLGLYASRKQAKAGAKYHGLPIELIRQVKRNHAMKSMLAAITLGAAFIAPTAHAGEWDCQFIARFAELSAELRDFGTTRGEMMDRAHQESRDQATEDHAVIAIEYIYSYPRMSPRDEGNGAYDYCVTQMRGES